MRVVLSVTAVVAIGASILSGVLWRDLHDERRANQDLTTKLDAARTALARQPVVTTVVENEAASSAADTPPEAPPKISREEAIAVITADSAKVQKKLLEDAEFRKARLDQARQNMRRRYAGLAEALGISEQEAEAVIDRLAEDQVRMELRAMELAASGTVPDEAAMAEMTRLQQEEMQKQKEALTARLGPERYEQLQEFEMSQPSRQRVNNLTSLLAQGGRPLSDQQKRSLTSVIIAEQKRQESEAQSQREAGQDVLVSQQDRVADGNRRILDAATGFLDPQQLEMVRGRFEQRSAMGRATNQVQQRVREAVQEGQD